MVSLKENAGTVITRDKRRAAGSCTRICPSNHGKHKSLQRAPWGRESFASSSQCCCQGPHTSPRGHGRVCDSLLPEQPWVSVLQTHFCFLPLCLVRRASQHLPVPTSPGSEAKTCLALVWDGLCREGWAQGSTAQPRSEKEKQSRAHSVEMLSLLLPSCDFTPYCPSTPCPHFFYSTITPDSLWRSSLAARGVREEFN